MLKPKWIVMMLAVNSFIGCGNSGGGVKTDGEDTENECNTGGDGDTCGDSNADSDNDTEGNSDTNSVGDTDTDTDNDADTDTDNDADTDTDNDADTDTDSDADADSDTDTDTDVSSDSINEPDGNADTDTGIPMVPCEGGLYDSAMDLCWENPLSMSDVLLWNEAVDHCEQLTTAGHDDWRLPKIQELISLIRGCGSSRCGVTDPECLDSSCNDGPDCQYCTIFEGPGNSGCFWDPGLSGSCTWYWSSSIRENYVWNVSFGGGNQNDVDIDTPEFTYHEHVRCVRSGS